MALRQCCATGSLHTGTPTGRIEKLHGLDCYVAEAPSGAPNGVVVIIPDAFGWTLPNNRILADAYAKEGGFRVLLPEFMDGTGIPESALISVAAFKATGFFNQLYKVAHALHLIRLVVPFFIYARPAVAAPRIYSFLKAIKKDEAKGLPVGVAGFCWGGYLVTQLCSDTIKADDGSRLVDCGFVAHPSLLKFPKDIEKIKLPYSCAAAELDFMMNSANAAQTREILAAKTLRDSNGGISHEFVLYEGVHHGFAVRADEDQKNEAEAGKKAEAQAVKWFSKWFKNPPPS